ncbi:MAG: hypothetical protein ACQEQU_06955 [Spirochaetota bacterium]
MKKKLCISSLMMLFALSLLFPFELKLPETIPAYVDLEISLDSQPGDPEVETARFYFRPSQDDDLLFLNLEPQNGSYTGTLPGTYVTGPDLEYFVEVLRTDGVVQAVPSSGTYTAAVEPDTTPPEVNLILPEDKTFTVSQPQVLIIEVRGETTLDLGEVLVNGEPLEQVELLGNLIKGIYTPADNQDVTVQVTVSDASGNTTQEQYSLAVVGKPKKPLFTADGSYYAGAEVGYTISSEQEGLSFPGELFEGFSQEIELDFGVGAEGQVRAGPLAISGSLDLADSRDIREYFEPNYTSFLDYPYLSALTSDFYDVLRLWNPYAFNYGDGYGDNGIRAYETNNAFLIDVTLFSDIMRYSFGDQTIHFQDQTVKDLPFRGSSFHLDIPFISLSVGNGFTDLGLEGAAWPQAFMGLQFGLDVFDYWYFQTNISFISDYQGPYSETKTGDRPIGDLFDLIAEDDTYKVAPQENLVIGLGTGINTKWFELKGEAGLTLYVDDAGGVVDLQTLLEDFGMSESEANTITGPINQVESYFPLFDYFPINDGFAPAAIAGSLWGVTYGADISITDLGIDGWFRKTDGSYKSLGASLSSGLVETGGTWELSLGKWGLGLGYSWEKTNISDILINDVLPLVENFVTLPTMVGDIVDAFDPERSTPEITHKAAVKLQSPNLGAFGRFTTGADFTLEKTDEPVNIYDEAFIIGGSVAWRSQTYKFDQLSIGLSLKTDDAYRLDRIIDGSTVNTSSWTFGVSGALKVSYDFVGLSASYARDWGDAASGEDTVHTVKSSLSFKDLWFDKIKVGGTWKETYTQAGVHDEQSVSADFGVEKDVGMLTTGIDLSAGYTNNFVDNTKDEASWECTVYGGISL